MFMVLSVLGGEAWAAEFFASITYGKYCESLNT